MGLIDAILAQYYTLPVSFHKISITFVLKYKQLFYYLFVSFMRILKQKNVKTKTLTYKKSKP